MTRKRLMKLLGGLGWQRNEINRFIDHRKEYETMTDLLERALVMSVDSMPTFFGADKKAEECFVKWEARRISDGEAVKTIGHLKMNNRHVLVMDKTKNKMFIV